MIEVILMQLIRVSTDDGFNRHVQHNDNDNILTCHSQPHAASRTSTILKLSRKRRPRTFIENKIREWTFTRRKANCWSKIMGNCEGRKKTQKSGGGDIERKIWIKGISSMPSQVPSQIAAL